MKTLYKAMMIFGIFPIVVLMVNSMGIFDESSTFYSDVEVNSEFNIQGNPAETVFTNLFAPSRAIGGRSVISIVAIVIIISTVGGIGAYLTHGSFTPILVAIIGYSFANMVMKSYGFFSKLFNNTSWNSGAMTYLGLCIGVVLVILIAITIVETPSHGRS